MATSKFTLSTSQLPHAIPDARNAPSWKEPVNLVHCPARGSEKLLATSGGSPRLSKRQKSLAAAAVAALRRSAPIITQRVRTGHPPAPGRTVGTSLRRPWVRPAVDRELRPKVTRSPSANIAKMYDCPPG